MASDTAQGYEGILPYYGYGCLKTIYCKLQEKVIELAKKTKKVGQDDPRRIVHSLKVGLAITLASLFYYFEPLYDGFGSSAIWAMVTVVVVFEFSVGATFGKGLNRVMATLLGGALGFGSHYLATLCGEKGQPVLLGAFVLTIATTATFVRFFPDMKMRYDYGLLIFILTFSMVAVSSYRDDEILKLAFDRFLTILIGTFISIFICISVWPIWIGADLHHLTTTNIENLAIFFQDFGVEFFRLPREGEFNKACMKRYRSVLTSKQSEESMANLARWEPRHGKFRFRHPWKQYLKIGSFARECAYRFQVLNGYLNSDHHIQTSLQIEGEFKEECLRMCNESGKALTQLALAIKNMTPPTSANSHIEKARAAAEKLSSLLTIGQLESLEMVAAATLISLLFDSFSCIEKIADSISELASLGKFKTVELQLQPSSVVPEHQDLIQV